MFKLGQTYTRQEISHALGGSIQLYLPSSGGRVVCGCFKRDARLNPGAPEVVTFGKGEYVEGNAELLAREADPIIPVFLFQASGAWEYVGRYRCTGLSTDPAVLRREMQANPQRGVIAGVLYFERVGD
jgi:hypothetical protein